MEITGVAVEELFPEDEVEPVKVTRKKAFVIPSRAVILESVVVPKLVGMFVTTSIAVQFVPLVLYSQAFVENPVVVFWIE
ncbi:hypothetical protein EBT11_09330 [bacterium]|nr:hypothetical protein [bacterium]